MKPSRVPALVAWIVLIFFYLPLVIVVLNSFNEARFGGQWTGFSLKWYQMLFSNRDIWAAVQNTLLVATAATVVSVVLGTLAAWALHRHHGRLQRVHYLVVYSPLVVPDILMGISLLLFFVSIGLDRSLLTVMLSHITFCVSYVAFAVLGRLQDFDDSILDAARDLGADARTTFIRVLLPMLAPGIIAGALLAFTLSIDDFVITFMVGGPGSTTLPVRVYGMMKSSFPAVINALSVILMAVTFLIVLISQRYNTAKS